MQVNQQDAPSVNVMFVPPPSLSNPQPQTGQTASIDVCKLQSAHGIGSDRIDQVTNQLFIRSALPCPVPHARSHARSQQKKREKLLYFNSFLSCFLFAVSFFLFLSLSPLALLAFLGSEQTPLKPIRLGVQRSVAPQNATATRNTSRSVHWNKSFKYTKEIHTEQEEEENKLATVCNVRERERERDTIAVDNSNLSPFLRLVRSRESPTTRF